MRLDIEQARNFFEALPASVQMPTLHPDYVVADAQRSAGLTPFFWGDTEGTGSLFLAGHISNIPETNLWDIQSAYGYGGLIWSGVEKESMNNLWEQYDSWCKRESVVVEFLRFHPMLENWKRFPGEVFFQRKTITVDLTVGDLMSSYKTRVRTAIRKAVKNGLYVEWIEKSKFVALFPKFYREAMLAIGAEDEYFFHDQYFESLCNLRSAKYAVCIRDSEIIAAAIFLIGSEVMEYHLSAASQSGKQLGATNLILHEAAELGVRSGCKQLYLGGGTNNSTNNPLFFFKAGFSERTQNFYIGRARHLPDQYDALKRRFPEAYAKYPGRVLFYR